MSRVDKCLLGIGIALGIIGSEFSWSSGQNISGVGAGVVGGIGSIVALLGIRQWLFQGLVMILPKDSSVL